jgi:CRP-like cAMP-binding protein
VTKTISPEVHFPGDVIFHQGTSGNHLYFIDAGLVLLRNTLYHTETMDPEEVTHSRLGSVVNAISDGCYFGDVAVLLKAYDGGFEKRSASAQAKTLTMLYAIERPQLLEALHDCPEMLERMEKVARHRRDRMRLVNARLRASEKRLLVEALGGNVDMTKDEEDMKTELFVEVTSVRAMRRLYKVPLPQARFTA